MSTPLIGPAATALKVLRVKASRLAAEKRPLKCLLYGPHGTGKTETALTLARELAGDGSNIERMNGKEISIDYARQLKSRMHTRPLMGGCFIILADECDGMSMDAKDMILSVLDQMPEWYAFIGTSNLDLVNDPKLRHARFQTRLHTLEVGPPSNDEILAHVLTLHPTVPEAIARKIVELNEGCVRSSLIDAENYLDVQAAA